MQRPEGMWQKVDYILEFSKWLYQRQFALEDVVFLLKWSISILLSLGDAGDTAAEAPKLAGGPMHDTACLHSVLLVQSLLGENVNLDRQ